MPLHKYIPVLMVSLFICTAASAARYDVTERAGTLTASHTPSGEVTFVLHTDNPAQAAATLQKAQTLEHKGIKTTVLLEDKGVLLLKQVSVHRANTSNNNLPASRVRRPLSNDEIQRRIDAERKRLNKTTGRQDDNFNYDIPIPHLGNAYPVSFQNFEGQLQACPACLKGNCKLALPA